MKASDIQMLKGVMLKRQGYIPYLEDEAEDVSFCSSELEGFMNKQSHNNQEVIEDIRYSVCGSGLI